MKWNAVAVSHVSMLMIQLIIKEECFADLYRFTDLKEIEIRSDQKVEPEDQAETTLTG